MRAGFPPFVWSTLCCALLSIGCAKGCGPTSAPPNALGKLPSFELVNQDGQAFGSQDLDGKAYVASFFFTSCVTICPKILGAMSSLQTRFAHEKLDVQLVSFTVDPDTDTPEKLKAAGQKMGADFTSWTFLTGTKDQLKEVIVGGFKTFVGSREVVGDDLFDIGHGARLVLVDQGGFVRGNFETNEHGLAELTRTARTLAR
jgi:protein SCO1/2